MIRILLNNEDLDIDNGAVVTFKKAQLLNGIQGAYSFSNNFNLKDSSKNRRLLGINYLPNSKAKSMTVGYDVDVILNGCIFLKGQKLKVQKEAQDSIPVYLVFTDSFLVAKAKSVLMNQINTGVVYDKDLANFMALNTPDNTLFRTAPVSAQDESGLVVVEEVPALINIKELVLKVFTQLGYAYTGDILTDTNIDDYYTNSNIGVYGPNGKPLFERTLTTYDFIVRFLKTFNGYIEVSDSSKSVALYFWKNIESIKDNFVDYSDKFVNYTEYTFEAGLAKVNTLSYAESPAFYNGFFNNNKSLVDKKEYLKSDFGAGALRLFDDQDLEEDGTILPRTIGEETDPQTLNIFRFESETTSSPVYSGGVLAYHDLYKAFSPNILELWELFHKPYTANIALPTIGLLTFRYDAIFLANLKMTEVFFIKQLSTYWLPIEINFTSKKEAVKVKALMIEKTAIDAPEVFDQSLSVGFYGDVFILDVFALYSAQNVSPPASIIISAADLTKNDIFVNGTQVLAFPTAIDVSMDFELKVSNIEPENVLSNSNIIFRFVSEEGGVSRDGTINVAHNGRADFISEFRSTPGVQFSYLRENVSSFFRFLNYSGKVTTPINIVDTLSPLVGDVATVAERNALFKMLSFDRASTVKIDLTVAHIKVGASSSGVRAATSKARFIVYVNGAEVTDVYSIGIVDSAAAGFSSAEAFNVSGSRTFSVNANDEVLAVIYFEGSTPLGVPASTMTGEILVTDVIWKFSVTEQL